MNAACHRHTESLWAFHQQSTRVTFSRAISVAVIPSTPFTSANWNLIRPKSVLPLLKGEPISPGACRSPWRVWAPAAGLRLPSLPQSDRRAYGDTRLAERLPKQPALQGRYAPLTNEQVFPPHAIQNRHRSHQSGNWNEFKRGVTSTF